MHNLRRIFGCLREMVENLRKSSKRFLLVCLQVYNKKIIKLLRRYKKIFSFILYQLVWVIK